MYKKTRHRCLAHTCYYKYKTIVFSLTYHIGSISNRLCYFKDIDIPVLIATETEVSYNAPLDCSKAFKASQNLRMNLESSLQCAQNKTCTVNVQAKVKCLRVFNMECMLFCPPFIEKRAILLE